MSACEAAVLRDTPVGAVAADWEMGVISDFVAALHAGVSVNAVETDAGCAENEVGVLKTSAVLQGKFYSKQHKVVVPKDAERVATSVAGDRIIISRMNTPALVGESGYVREDMPNLFLPDRLWQTEPSERPHLQRWLSYWLQHPNVRRLIAAGASGTSNSMKNISKETVLSLPVPRTPLPEQEKIVAILVAVDDKLDVISRQIEATQSLRDGLMQILFNRGVGTQDAKGRWRPHSTFKDSELGEIPAAWECQTLGELAQESRKRNAGQVADNLLCGVLKEQGLVPMRERVKGTSTDRCRVVEANAFAYNPMRINIGSIARNQHAYPVMVSPDYVVFATNPQKLLCSYLDHFRRSDSWQSFVGRSGDGGVRIRIYFDDLAQLRIRVPPIKEQRKIVEILDGLTAKINALKVKRNFHQTLKRGLMQKLLTGEWRVNIKSTARSGEMEAIA
jgi:type I restriction enzyme S subunit